MKLKTSVKISLKFTLFSVLLVFLFSVTIFSLYFRSWYSKSAEIIDNNAYYRAPLVLKLLEESWGITVQMNVRDAQSIQGLQTTQKPQIMQRPIMFQNPQLFVQTGSQKIPSPLERVPLTFFEEEFKKYSLLSFFSRGRVSFAYKDGSYYMYSVSSVSQEVKLLDVTWFVYAQGELAQVIILWDLIFILLIYLVSLYFVKSSLEKLNKLVNFVENIDFERVPEPLDFEAHPRDEIKLISNALNTSLEKLHRQFATLKDFTANASHELKTPLMMISSEIDLALKTKKYKESLMMIKSTTKRLSELLDQLSLITHLESQHTFSKETIFLCEFGNVLVDRLKTSYPDADLQFNCDNESFVTANASLLEIVITNLLENACKYAGKDAQISLIIHKDSLVVQDTGIGIDPAIHDLIFERFWQKEKTENTDHSFGLGLYLVKKIVELHGWNIDLTSEPRKWSIFRITFTSL